MAARELAHRSAFEQMGETQVRVLAQGSGEAAAEAVAWLAELAAKNAAEADAKRDAREERTLAIASEALAIAKEQATSAARAASAAERQARWALWAAIIAVIAAAIATKDQVLALIFGTP